MANMDQPQRKNVIMEALTMAADKIRMGVIGANIHRGWAPRSHLPAIAASPGL